MTLEAQPGRAPQDPPRVSSAAAPLLEVQGLEIALHDHDATRQAVQALDFTLQRGQTFALVGESGCGKSLTALSLLRLLPPVAQVAGGAVRLDGTDLLTLPAAGMQQWRGRRISMIFQEPSTSLNPVMRVGDQVAEVLRAHTRLRGRALRERVLAWLTRVGIPEPASRIDDYPFQLSGGQKQRVMIAMALAAEPDVLVADEPTTALDVTIQAQVLALLQQLQRELGMGLLLITHDLAVVRQVADHVALMYGGRIVADAPTQAFFDRPPHPYAQLLLDAVPDRTKRGAPLARLSSAELFARLARGEGSDAASSRPTVSQATASVLPSRPDAASTTVLTIQGLSVAYPVRRGLLRRASGWTPVLRDIDLRLAAGRTTALLGESGCGKTTLGKAVMRLLDGGPKVEGSIRLGEADLLRASGPALRRLRRQVQIVFQDPFSSLNPRLRIGETLDEGLAALRPELSATARQERLQGLIERVGLPPDTLTRHPHAFSGGQRQRIAIARALAVEPTLLICDEPTSALDVSVQAQILNLLRELQAETGMAYLFITHDFSVVEYIADDIAIMEGGRIVEHGPALEVLETPRHPVTRRLLAAVPRLASVTG